MPVEPQPIAIDGAAAAIYRDAPQWDGMKTAAIGAFRCDDAGSGTALLTQIAATLAAEGFAAVIGPMDGDTWHRYRVVTESDGSAPYLLEPVSDPGSHQAFLDAGFAPISHYVSARGLLVDAIAKVPPEIP